MEFYIKEAIESDMADINKMLTELIQDERQYDNNINKNYVVNNYYEQYLGKKDSVILVAKDNKKNILGYCFGFIMDFGSVYNKKVAKLDAVFVKSEYRKNGIAREMIDNFIKWANENQVYAIELTVCSENGDAIRVYQKQGFSKEKIILKKFI